MSGVTARVVTRVPTREDVKLLLDAFPPERIEYGTVIPYEKIESTIRASRKSCRWGTVVSAWRKHLREFHNIELFPTRKGGFFRPEENARADGHTHEAVGGLSGMLRGTSKLRRVDRSRLTDKEADAVQRRLEAFGRIAAVAVEETRQLTPAPARVQPQLPRKILSVSEPQK